MYVEHSIKDELIEVWDSKINYIRRCADKLYKSSKAKPVTNDPKSPRYPKRPDSSKRKINFNIGQILLEDSPSDDESPEYTIFQKKKQDALDRVNKNEGVIKDHLITSFEEIGWIDPYADGVDKKEVVRREGFPFKVNQNANIATMNFD